MVSNKRTWFPRKALLAFTPWAVGRHGACCRLHCWTCSHAQAGCVCNTDHCKNTALHWRKRLSRATKPSNQPINQPNQPPTHHRPQANQSNGQGPCRPRVKPAQHHLQGKALFGPVWGAGHRETVHYCCAWLAGWLAVERACNDVCSLSPAALRPLQEFNKKYTARELVMPLWPPGARVDLSMRTPHTLRTTYSQMMQSTQGTHAHPLCMCRRDGEAVYWLLQPGWSGLGSCAKVGGLNALGVLYLVLGGQGRAFARGCAAVHMWRGAHPACAPCPQCSWCCCLGGACSLVEQYGPVPRFVLEQPLQRGAASLEQDLKEMERALDVVDVEQV